MGLLTADQSQELIKLRITGKKLCWEKEINSQHIGIMEKGRLLARHSFKERSLMSLK